MITDVQQKAGITDQNNKTTTEVNLFISIQYILVDRWPIKSAMTEKIKSAMTEINQVVYDGGNH